MSASSIGRIHCVALATLCCCFAHSASAAVAVHVVRTDLRALIRAAADTPVQFAVLVPHAVSTGDAGDWSVAGEWATWSYAVKVPTAVSLSFHVIKSSLPPSAILMVRGTKTASSYRGHDVHHGELWSRIYPGDALQFTLTVATAERSRVSLGIVSLQAGYRALGPGVTDHPYYRQLKAQASAASGNAACVTNYECAVTPANAPLGLATAALVIGNLYQCTGVLLNNVPGDSTPYMLTARHCETGRLGGGDPGAASSAVVYWNATTPCGATLGSLYDGDTTTFQTGATTMVEQQDAWLIRLDLSPVANNAQLAGFDATGGAVQGGYSIHQAEGYDEQFAGWFGKAAAVQESGVLGVSYLSNFLETVNQTGNIGPGASGSGLFNQNNLLVGTLTLGRSTNDPSGYGACPVTNPPQPNGTNGVADFTALAAVWNSTADTTSNTGSVTLKSVLDPGNTGTTVVSSAPAAVLTFSASEDTVTFNVIVGLSWSAANATQCAASGGAAGDGWSGTLANVGTQSVTETSVAAITYTLTCGYPGGRTAKASVVVNWVGPSPQLQFNPSTSVAWATSPVTLSWTSNVAPCSITGGNVSLSSLPASSTVTVTQAGTGDVLYTLNCGPTNDSGTITTLVQWITPSLLFRANGTDRLLGADFELRWDTPNACTPSGGAPNDGWASTAFPPGSLEAFDPRVTTLGTYTYTLTCSSGPVSLVRSVTVTFENGAPSVTASLDKSTVTFSNSPAGYITMSYSSNLSECTLNTTPNLPLGNSGSLDFPPLPQGLVAFAPAQSGTYQVSMQCAASINGVQETATTPVMSVTVLPPPPPTATVSISPSTAPTNSGVQVAWTSTNASGCIQTGGILGGLWTDGPVMPSGSINVDTQGAGQFVFGLTCQSIDPSVGPVSTQTTLNVVNLTATLDASSTAVTTGGSFTLTWSSTGATTCTADGGGANGTAWSGTLGTSGSVKQTATAVGTFTYTVNCFLGNTFASAQASVQVSAPPSGSVSQSSGGGGGGGLGATELALLAALRALARRRRVRIGC
jgi:hypothetical protein